MRQLILEYRIDLPDNIHKQGDVIKLTQEPCDALSKALKDAGVAYEEKSFTVVKRGPKTQPAPAISLAPPPAAAE